MEGHIFLLYVATWAVVALTPGPAVMYSMATATRHGVRASLAGICGIQAGNLVLFASVAAGLGALLAASNGAFLILRIVGAAYLFWLGLRVIANSFRPSSEAHSTEPAVLDSRTAVQGLLIQVTNPKALLFVTALLPQFINPARSAVVQLTLLVVATVVVDTLVLAGYAFLAERGAQRFRNSRVKSWCERAYGAALMALAGKLLVGKK